jgi:hypothetical protein
MLGAGFEKNINMVSQLIRVSTPLTLSMVSCSHVNIEGANKLGLYFSFTKGYSSGLVTRIEESLDNVNFYRELEQYQTGTGTTLYSVNDRTIKIATTAITKWKWEKDLTNNARWVRISVRALTSSTNAAVKIVAVKSVTG